MLSRTTRIAPALLLAAGVAACNTSAADEPTDAPQVAAVEQRTLEITAEAAGQIEPIRVVEVKSKASGEVRSMNVEIGDLVEQGDPLVEIDPRDVRNAHEQAKADLEVARARLQTSQAQRNRIEELRKANVATDQELETALLDEANARAQLVKAETSLQLAAERLGDVSIRAPITGTIISRPPEIGTIIASASANVSGGTTLMTMADLSAMQVRALVDETDLGRISAGQEVEVSVEAYPDRRFRGLVLKIEPQAVVEQNVTMFPVLVRLDNREGLLKPGMNADVQVQIARRENVVAVPSAAVVSPRDAMAAAAVLGVDEATMQSVMSGGRRMADAAAAPEVASPPDGVRPPTAGGETAASVAAGSTDCAALVQRVREQGGFDNLSEADRAALRGCRESMGGGPGGLASGQRRARPRDGDAQPGVLFVQTATGIEPRRVMLGLNDWEYTEVLDGVDPGEQVVLVSVARLQQQQVEMMERFRERAGGVFPGAGGGRGR